MSNSSSKAIFKFLMKIPYSICVNNALIFTSQNCIRFFDSSNTKQICSAVDDHHFNELAKKLVHAVKKKLTSNDPKPYSKSIRLQNLYGF